MNTPDPLAPPQKEATMAKTENTESTETKRALLVVDVTPTFCEGGGLAVEGGNAVADAVAAHIDRSAGRYQEIVASEDWHIDPGDHWAPDGHDPDFSSSWPVHGVAGTDEARVHPAVQAALERSDLDHRLVRKGMHSAAYSAFEGVVVNDPDVLDPEGPGLAEWLRSAGVTALDVVGIATDHCVLASARDAIAEGFDVTVITDLSVGVAPGTSAAALDELAESGATMTTAGELATAGGVTA